MKVVLASRNPGKLRELRALLPGWELEPADTSGVEETGATFVENARLKALHARRAAPGDAWALGEDSGLEVDRLGGAPGVRSARFAGEEASDEENVERLLRELDGVELAGRTARYVCELVLVSPDGAVLRGTGTLEGGIGLGRRGSGGFGYDPVFVPEGASLTVAELGDGWKAAASHRASAVRALLAALAPTTAGQRGCARLPAVDAAEALADLTQISTQIELAVLVDASGEVLASAGTGSAQAGTIAAAGRRLLAAAEDAMGEAEARERLVQLQVALPDGCVFLVQDDERLVVAVTVAEPTVGLIFYDLKTCLRHVAGESLTPKPKARAGSREAEDAGEG